MEPIWRPSPERIAASQITAFIDEVNKRWGASLAGYSDLHRFSVEKPERFWLAVWDFCGVIAEHRGDVVLADADRMPGARWFPEARLNFARNLLRRRDDAVAIVGLREDGRRRTLTFAALYDLVSRLARAMAACGVGPGDRVAGYMPNVPETVAGMLAATSIGAIWTCCGPEFGVGAALDRIGQVEPKLLFTADGYLYGGQRFDLTGKAAALANAMPGLHKVVVVANLAPNPDVDAIPLGQVFDDFIAPFAAGEIDFASLPFDHPVFILYSSGTTGAPKCIVHGAGCVLIENLKSLALQFDVKPGDCVYWWTTTGWAVWNLMVFALAREAGIVLYDGSPFHPSPDAILRHAAEEKATFIRLTPKYVETLLKSKLVPKNDLDLSALRTMIVSSSPFGEDGYEYIYRNVKEDIHLGSPSGGTDPLGSLVSANPISPVWSGEIQGPALGFSIEIFDAAGKSVVGAAGELVVTRPFPSMPIAFWNDPDGTLYGSAYFRHFPNVWRHGDWATITPRGGIVIFGRSDATLKARGIRIGTSEIYRTIVLVPGVEDGLIVNLDLSGGKFFMPLFVKLSDGLTLDDAMRKKINDRLRTEYTPRHIPDKIYQVPAIPYTISGKRMEVPVRRILAGFPLAKAANRDAMANPAALDFFIDYARTQHDYQL
jgi:acetoacetyl-CoA synthetase